MASNVPSSPFSCCPLDEGEISSTILHVDFFWKQHARAHIKLKAAIAPFQTRNPCISSPPSPEHHPLPPIRRLSIISIRTVDPRDRVSPSSTATASLLDSSYHPRSLESSLRGRADSLSVAEHTPDNNNQRLSHIQSRANGRIEQSGIIIRKRDIRNNGGNISTPRAAFLPPRIPIS
jgi:hypothetical protein